MSKGLDPQEVANALTGNYRFLAMYSKNVWYVYTCKPIYDKTNSHHKFDIGTASRIQEFNINYDGEPESAIFEKQEQFSNGEIILALFFSSNVYEVARYLDYNRVYSAMEATNLGAYGVEVSKIIKFDPELLGTVAE